MVSKTVHTSDWLVVVMPICVVIATKRMCWPGGSLILKYFKSRKKEENKDVAVSFAGLFCDSQKGLTMKLQHRTYEM